MIGHGMGGDHRLAAVDGSICVQACKAAGRSSANGQAEAAEAAGARRGTRVA